MAAMYPFSERELAARAAQPSQYQPKQWVRRGFFKQPRMSRREVALKASNTRLWLEYTLHAGPMPAKEVLQLAEQDDISERSLRRAKRYHKVKSLKVGGRRQGWGAVWVWIFPQCVS